MRAKSIFVSVALIAATIPAALIAQPASATPPGPEPTPPNQLITFYWGLASRQAQAEERLKAISDPASPTFRQYLGVAAVSKQFGATNRTIRTVKNYVASKGLRARIDKSRLVVAVTGTAGQFETAFGQPIQSFTSGQFIDYGPQNNPIFPRAISRVVPWPIWVSTVQLPTARSSDPNLKRLSKIRTRTLTYPRNKGTLIHSCKAVKESPYGPYMMSVGQAASAYKLTGLQPKYRGDVGRPSIGIIAEGSGFQDSLVAQQKACSGVSGTPVRVFTPGNSAPLAGGDEGNLDVQMVVAAMVHAGRFPVYETNSANTGLFLAYLSALNSADRPSVLSNSYGSCEQQLPQNTRPITDAVLTRLALVGTSALVAAGDRGSSSCVNNDTGVGDTSAAVTYPASSKFVTAVGGTRLVLNRSNNIKQEVAWNDTVWTIKYAGGGGSSVMIPRPWWQPAIGTGNPAKRAVPDISAHAEATFPGYPIFFAQAYPNNVAPEGGTSAATPLVAAGIALINSHRMSRGAPALGFLNPWLYQLPPEVLRDVTVGTNDVYGIGCCRARRGYDRASGLGSPNFEAMLAHAD